MAGVCVGGAYGEVFLAEIGGEGVDLVAVVAAGGGGAGVCGVLGVGGVVLGFAVAEFVAVLCHHVAALFLFLFGDGGLAGYVGGGVHALVVGGLVAE